MNNRLLCLPQDKVLFVAFGENCFELSQEGCTDVVDLQSTQEEADTRMLLHILHGHRNLFDKFVVHTPDTDVLILCLGYLGALYCDIYIKTGVKDKSRLINLQRIKEKFESVAQEHGYSTNDLFTALISLHAFTGCDTISAFAGKGKVTAIKCLLDLPADVQTFKLLGSAWNVTDELMQSLEKFTCKLYRGKCDSVNLLRYEIYCSKRGKITGQDRLPADVQTFKLLGSAWNVTDELMQSLEKFTCKLYRGPCHSAFVEHCKRANYQSRIWRLASEKNPDVPSPVKHGWEFTTDDDGSTNLTINWMECKPAPEEASKLFYGCFLV